MNVLVTGASGFLGRFLCQRLEPLCNNLIRCDSKNCNLLDKSSLEQFNAVKLTHIYHLAAWTQAGDFCLFHPGEQWLINQTMNTNMLSWWKERQPQAKMICMGTSCSYDPELPHAEDKYLQGMPIESLFTYAMTKRMLLCGLMALHKQYGLKYLYAVPSTLYGPSYHLDGRQMHFIFDLIRKILHAKTHGSQVTLWGDGHQRRELVFVEDFVDVLLLLEKQAENLVINIGAGEDYSIRDFAQKICINLAYDFEQIAFDTTKYVGAKSKLLHIKRLRQLCPSFRPISLDQGLKTTIEWFAEATV